MQLHFEPINLEKQPEYLEHFALCPQKASDYSFVNLWGWAEEYGLYWSWTEELVWIKQTIPEISYWAPVGPWENINWNKCLEKHLGSEISFVRVPEKLLQRWNMSLKDSLSVEEARGHWDYLYSVTDLVELGGNRFHKKKNLLNQFKKNYDFKYISFGAEMIHMAMDMQKDWCTWRDCESSESLSAENSAILRILKNREKLKGLTGGAIIVGQEMAAYTIAEKLTNDTLLIHFEKGSPDYKGIYQAVNQMFLQHSDVKFTTVNREQDLDDEGLRKAKLSYHPSDFIKKYRVNRNP
jgi:hypothetical protein